MSEAENLTEPAAAPDTTLQFTSSVPAFASPIDTFMVPDQAGLNAQLLEAIAQWRLADPGEITSNRQGWHSHGDFFKRDEPAFRTLQRHIRHAAVHSIRRYWRGFDPSRHRTAFAGWANVSGKGAFNVPHAHGHNHFSGCYYVSLPDTQDDRSGDIEFLNPAGAIVGIGKFGERMVRQKYRVRPRAGQILIFPGYLSHWVYPNLEDAERVSIAFNIHIGEVTLDD